MDQKALTVGVFGLGIMGSAMARHLIAAGLRTIGFDTMEVRRKEAQAFGAEIVGSAPEVAATADILLASLPSDDALVATVDAILAAPRRGGRVLVELSTLSLGSKTEQQGRLESAGVRMLDCPVSGTGAQAARRDIVLYVSGDRSAHDLARPVFDAIARDAVYLGAFGNGTRMKLVANLLVAIHNVAAAEAINLGLAAGLDPESLVKVLGSGAGGSRMLELRGPMMVRNEFLPATMKLDVWQKDMRLIGEFAAATGAATPLFSATVPLYATAVTEGRADEDTAAVFAVLHAATKPPEA